MFSSRISQPRRRIAGFVAFALSATTAVGLAIPAPTLAWDSNEFSSASEHQLIALTNESRAAAGLKSLKISSTLSSIARWRSKDMIKRDYFSHTIPGVGKVFSVISDKGFCYRLAGENIGWNNDGSANATASIHQMFMNSSGHRENILGKAWDVMGIGAYQGADGKKMWTVLFADTSGCGSPDKKPTPKTHSKPKSAPTTHQESKPKPTAKPTSTTAPAPSPTPTDDPASLLADDNGDPTLTLPDDPDAPDAAAVIGPDEIADAGAGHGLRVLTPPQPPGLLDTIMGGVAGFFLGG
jgi:uncharacterized protein YkwD